VIYLTLLRTSELFNSRSLDVTCNPLMLCDDCTGEDATGLKMLVYGHIAGVDVPFPLDNPDACKDSNITCPIKKDQAYGYRNVIFVKTSYPSVRRNSHRLSFKAAYSLALLGQCTLHQGLF